VNENEQPGECVNPYNSRYDLTDNKLGSDLNWHTKNKFKNNSPQSHREHRVLLC